MPTGDVIYTSVFSDILGNNGFAWTFWVSAIFLFAFMLVKYYIFRNQTVNDFGDLISEYLIDIEPIILSIIISRLAILGQPIAILNCVLFMAITIAVIVVCCILRNKSIHVFSMPFKKIILKSEIYCYIFGIIVSISWISFAYTNIIIL